MLSALSQMPPTCPPTALLVAGDGPLRSMLENQARRLGTDARFLGFVSDMPAFMNACDIVVFPTQPELGEGFGLAALEAMAAGRPVIATAIASLPEVVIDGGSGMLVAPGSAAALAKAISLLASDEVLRRRLGEAASIRATEAFSIESMTEATIAVYKELVGSLR